MIDLSYSTVAHGDGDPRGRAIVVVDATSELPTSPGHPFYTRLNAVLDAGDFDRFVEGQCRLAAEPPHQPDQCGVLVRAEVAGREPVKYGWFDQSRRTSTWARNPSANLYSAVADFMEDLGDPDEEPLIITSLRLRLAW